MDPLPRQDLNQAKRPANPAGRLRLTLFVGP